MSIVDDSQLKEWALLANHAPSGDNCQPWKFKIENLKIHVYHDPVRDQHALNPEFFTSRLAFGCYTETLNLIANSHGYCLEVENLQFQDSDAPWGIFSFSKTSVPSDLRQEDILARHTDRTKYKKSNDLLLKVIDFCEQFKFTHLTKIKVLENLNPEALALAVKLEASMWKSDSIVKDLLHWVRFSDNETQVKQDGMPWKTLGVNWLESRALLASRRCKSFRQILRTIIMPLGAPHTLKQQLKTSHVCFFTIPDLATDINFFEAGRLALKIWTFINAQGGSVQPLTLSTTIGNFERLKLKIDGFDERDWSDYMALQRKIYSELNLPEGQILAWGFRFGIGKGCPDLTPRLNPNELIR